MNVLPAAVTLHRHYTSNPRTSSAAEYVDAQRCDTITDHPAVPEVALPHLRRHLVSAVDREQRIVWHHRSGREWAAVTDLHHGRQHDAATVLAEFLLWTERHGTRDDYTAWELRPVGAAP